MFKNINLKLLAVCLIIIGIPCGILFTRESAHASELEPTARDWQRLNACAQYSVQYEGTTEDIVRCAAIGKGIARFESDSGKSRVAMKQNNSYGIMRFPKGKSRYLKTYKTTADCDLDYARIFWKFYRTTKIKDLALIWTGESHIAKKYANAVKSWYPWYHKLYSEMAK